MPTDAEVEAAARSFYEGRHGDDWAAATDLWKDGERRLARAALEAAERVRSLAATEEWRRMTGIIEKIDVSRA
jgi:hypothetical protein